MVISHNSTRRFISASRQMPSSAFLVRFCSTRRVRNCEANNALLWLLLISAHEATRQPRTACPSDTLSKPAFLTTP